MPFQWGRPITSYTRVETLLGRLLRGRPAQARRRRCSGLRYLNVGCGRNTHPDFVNLDYAWNRGIDVCWDITKPLPFEAGRFNGIFTEHCLEHVSFDECVAVFADFKRLLAPGGTLRLLLPDAGKYLDLYQRYQAGERVEFPYIDASAEQDLAEDSRFGFTPMMAVNRIFRGYGHRFAYDVETVTAMLRHCGFHSIERRGFREGADEHLLIDSEMRWPQSFCVEARA